MSSQISFSFVKKLPNDTRNNWVTMMFPTKCRYFCFLKQSHMNTCEKAFRELEVLGFEFGTIGFGGNHVHFQVNIPKKYGVLQAEILLKRISAERMFSAHPGFHKRYPRGIFWSRYEHHQSTGPQNKEESTNYILDQQRHHNITIINDIQQKLTV